MRRSSPNHPSATETRWSHDYHTIGSVHPERNRCLAVALNHAASLYGGDRGRNRCPGTVHIGTDCGCRVGSGCDNGQHIGLRNARHRSCYSVFLSHVGVEPFPSFAVSIWQANRAFPTWSAIAVFRIRRICLNFKCDTSATPSLGRLIRRANARPQEVCFLYSGAHECT